MKRLVLITAVLALAATGCKKPEGPKTTEVSVTPPAGPSDMLTPEPVPAPAPAPEIVAAPAPEPELPPPPPALVVKTHTVRKGETLWSLSRLYLGDPRRWQEIVQANPGLNPSALPVGKAIVIPEK